MSKLIIDTRNEQQLNELKQILASKGIAFQSEEDYAFEKQIKARHELASWAESLPKYEITDEEIQSVIEEARTELYARKNKEKGNH
mgnify:CR=1 FL=1